MKTENAALLAPTPEGFRLIVRMAYAAGRARGREEATRESQHLAARLKPLSGSGSLPETLPRYAAEGQNPEKP